MRKTKIIATIGPTSRDPETLDRLLAAGMDCAQLNFAHGTLEEHGEVIRTLRKLSRERQRPLAIIQELGGTRPRLGQIETAVQLNQGDAVSLVSEASSNRPDFVPFPQPALLQSMQAGDLVYIADGTICLEVLEGQGPQVKARVRSGGTLSSLKGVSLPGVTIDQPVLTESDKLALQFGLEQEVDWVAISGVRTAEDIRYANAYLDSIGSTALVMAKVEGREGADNAEPILEDVDGVIVDRGGLGVEIPMEHVPMVQKEIIKKANEAAKVCVVATQMFPSMVVSPTPTRAEISDTTIAVLDGCDAILLSDETTVGQYPIEVVNVASNTIETAETIYPYYKEFSARDRTQAIAAAAGRLTQVLQSRLIVITNTGRAAFEVSRNRPNTAIIVIAHSEAVVQRLTLGWGLSPVAVIPPEQDIGRLVAMAISASLDAGLLQKTDVVTIVHGFMTGVSGKTNSIQVLNMLEYLS